MEVPRLASLPHNPNHPPHLAWAVWGDNDELGTLNYLTNDFVVMAAREEIRTGARVGLNWSLQQMRKPPSFRNVVDHRIGTIEGGVIYDDTLHFDTQTSSQWDGFRHCGYADGTFYNGVTWVVILEKRSDRIGIHAWCKQGIVGRGVLVDFGSYAARHQIPFDPLNRSIISLVTINQVLEGGRIKIQKGDILVIRTGFLKAYYEATEEQLEQLMTTNPLQYPGVENSITFAEWLWNSGIADNCVLIRLDSKQCPFKDFSSIQYC